MRPELEMPIVPGSIIHRDPVVIEALCQGVPDQEWTEKRQEVNYEAFVTKSTLTPLVQQFDDHTNIYLAATPMNGVALQHLFLDAAPSKFFSYAIGDTKNDWDELYTNPDYKKLLELHRKIPNWDIFEPHREELLSFLSNAFLPAGKGKYVSPVIHIRKIGDELSWNFDNLPEDVQAILNKKADIYASESLQYQPILGPVLVAACSPIEMAKWGPTLPFSLKSNGSGQDMGATQALVLSLAISKQLLLTPFLKSGIQYAETGEIPASPSPDTVVLTAPETTKPQTKGTRDDYLLLGDNLIYEV